MKRSISFNKIIEEAQGSLFRFPFVLLSGLVATIYWFYLLEKQEVADLAVKGFYCAVLGISWLYSLTLVGERYFKDKNFRVYLPLVGLGLLVAYYFSLPERIESAETVLRMCLFMVISHLLASFAPYLRHNEPNGFWQYNQAIFIRFLLSVFYAEVLYIGIAIALGSLNMLFAADISWKVFSQLFGVISLFFNVWFFLSGVPKDFEVLEQEAFYPKGLKIFTQYVLLPLVTVYLSILYAYELKILVEFSLPKGWVVYLILAFSITGILSLLLIHPIRETEGNTWIKIYSRWFYLALIPLVALHFVAIIRRINDYGITELRYFVFILGCWLLGICLYFVFSKVKNIKVIPISLAILALLTSFGYWGAFYMAKQSQLNRLRTIFERNKVVNQAGFLVSPPTKKNISEEDFSDIKSIIQFLCDRQSEHLLQPYFKQPLDSIIKPKQNLRSYEKTERIVATLPFVENINEETYAYYNTIANEILLINTRGYDYWLNVNFYMNEMQENKKDSAYTKYSINKQEKFKLRINAENELQIKQSDTNKRLVNTNLKAFVEKLYNNYSNNSSDLKAEEMQIEQENEQVKCFIQIKNLELKIIEKKISISRIEGYVLLKIK